MDHPEGAVLQRADRVDFDPLVRLEFKGTQFSSDGGLLVMRELDGTLGLSDLASATLSDKAYDPDWIRDMIWEQGATDVIPSKANRKLPKALYAELYRQRNRIERFFGRLKASFRRIATRYEKTSRNFMAMIKLAAVRLWCRFYESAA